MGFRSRLVRSLCSEDSFEPVGASRLHGVRSQHPILRNSCGGADHVCDRVKHRPANAVDLGGRPQAERWSHVVVPLSPEVGRWEQLKRVMNVEDVLRPFVGAPVSVDEERLPLPGARQKILPSSGARVRTTGLHLERSGHGGKVIHLPTPL